MVKIENDCCDCAVGIYPCLGSDCPNRNVPHYYCDSCHAEEQLYEYEGQELCGECVLKQLEKVGE